MATYHYHATLNLDGGRPGIEIDGVVQVNTTLRSQGDYDRMKAAILTDHRLDARPQRLITHNLNPLD